MWNIYQVLLISLLRTFKDMVSTSYLAVSFFVFSLLF
jgi:hypothetical protein